MDWSDWGDFGIKYGWALGALPNMLLLVTPLWIAVWQQPRLERRRAEMLEASRVIAWPAETYASPVITDEEATEEDADVEPAYHGVVIANTSVSTALDVDLKLSTRRPGQSRRNRLEPEFSTIAGNRELILPPGTWFIPIQRNYLDIDEWMITVPVDTDGKLQVSMPGGHVFDLRMQQLRDRARRTPAPGADIGIGFLRFTLDTRSWWRDSSGALFVYSHAMGRRRGRRHARRRGASRLHRLFRRFRPRAWALPTDLPVWDDEFTSSELKSRGAAVESNGQARQMNKDIADRIEKDFRDRGRWAERNQGTGVHLRLNDDAGPYIRLAGSGTRYPDSLTVIRGQSRDKELSRLVFDAVLDALPPEYVRQIDLRNKTADFWQDEANFAALLTALDAGSRALAHAVHVR